MRVTTWAAVSLMVLATAALEAGQVYGTIVSDGKALASANIEIKCESGDPATGATGADGAYRINVAPQGQCTISLPAYAGRPSASIFSGPNPALYNFDLVKLGDGKYELRRR